MGELFELVPRETQKVETKHRRICTSIPVPESIEMFDEMIKYETRSNAGMPPVVWDHTEDGYKVCDPYGNKFIDFTSCILISNAGHANPEITNAAIRTLQKPLLATYLFCSQERIEAAKELISVCPIPDAKVFMISAGTEACEAALKLMRTYGKLKGGPEKKVIVTFKGSFHGRTLGSQMMGGMPELKEWIGNLDPDIVQAPYPNSFEYEWADPEKPGYSDDKMFQSLLDTIHEHNVKYENIAGIFIESYHAPLCYPLPKAYAKRLREFCDKYDILLGMDEIQIGACRSGKFWGFEHTGIIPDLFAAAKGMSGGLPQAALFGRRDVLDLYEPGDMSSTHSGSPVVSSATAANIRFLRDNKIYEQAAMKGAIMEKALKELKERFPHRIGYVGGIGMGRCVTFTDADKKVQPKFTRAVIIRALEKGLLFSTPVYGGGTMRLVPPLTMPVEALEEGLKVYAEAIAEVDAELPAF